MAIRFNFISRPFDANFKARITNANEKYATIDGGERKLKTNWVALLRVTNVASGCILVSCLDPTSDETSDVYEGSFCLPNG